MLAVAQRRPSARAALPRSRTLARGRRPAPAAAGPVPRGRRPSVAGRAVCTDKKVLTLASSLQQVLLLSEARWKMQTN